MIKEKVKKKKRKKNKDRKKRQREDTIKGMSGKQTTDRHKLTRFVKAVNIKQQRICNTSCNSQNSFNIVCKGMYSFRRCGHGDYVCVQKII